MYDKSTLSMNRWATGQSGHRLEKANMNLILDYKNMELDIRPIDSRRTGYAVTPVTHIAVSTKRIIGQ